MTRKADQKAESTTLLTAVERRRLAGETLCEQRTIQRWERGEPVRPATKKVLNDAARRLGLPVPEVRV